VDSILQQLQTQSIWDWLVLITGIIYVLLAARNNPICWFFGIISCAVLAVMTVVKYDLYADGILNLFYVIMGFVGLYNWRSKSSHGQLPISHIRFTHIAKYSAIGILCSILASLFLSEYTPAAATGLDSFTTVFSIIATLWLVKRYIENWMLWVAVDVLYVYLYVSRGAWMYAALMVVYTLIALQGYFLWKQQLGNR
jgi:nicotinamide mononucleotide transporter